MVFGWEDENIKEWKTHLFGWEEKWEGRKYICINLLPCPYYIGSVWIGLILLKLKTYCWNHCNKIIFKCVNSAVGLIFNEKIDKKWNLWVREQCTDILFTENWSKVVATVHVPYMNSSRKWGENAWKKKKKKKKENAELKRSKRNPNTH